MLDMTHDGHVFTNAVRVTDYWDGPDRKDKIVWCLTCGEVVSEVNIDD